MNISKNGKNQTNLKNKSNTCLDLFCICLNFWLRFLRRIDKKRGIFGLFFEKRLLLAVVE